MDCLVSNCKRFCKYKSYGYCNLHYQRYRRFGAPGESTEGQLRNGRTHNALYITWGHMLQRCLNSASPAYKHYGGRGITVCERWKSSDNFITDMSPKPGPEYTLDRIDNNGNYEPGNCKWATRTEQNNNRRNNIKLSINGIHHTVLEWSVISGVSEKSIYQRLRRGWTAERVIQNVDARYKLPRI